MKMFIWSMDFAYCVFAKDVDEAREKLWKIYGVSLFFSESPIVQDIPGLFVFTNPWGVVKYPDGETFNLTIAKGKK